MRYLILGSSGFLGKSIVNELLKRDLDSIVLFDKSLGIKEYQGYDDPRISKIKGDFQKIENFDFLVKDVDIVLHLISTTRPATILSNGYTQEIEENIFPTIKLLDACVRNKIKKVVFLSSGGTVYGNISGLSSSEKDNTNPICSYGIQKLMIEKYFFLYGLREGLNYNIIRLSNPYGPYQDPKSGLGAVTNFVYKAVKKEKIVIYGDGTAIRDYIYIDDAVQGILNICQYEGCERIFNLGTGEGRSLNEVIDIIEAHLNRKLEVEYCAVRKTDLEKSVLNVDLYTKTFGKSHYLTMDKGIEKMIFYFKQNKAYV